MSLKTLKESYPFTNNCPNIPHIDAGYCEIEHKEYFSTKLNNSTKLIMEIGCMAGKSTKMLLDCAPNAQVICIDPWWGHIIDTSVPAGTDLSHNPSCIRQFIRNMWDYKDRIIPIRRMSQFGLFEVRNHNVCPDFVYIDGEHSFQNVFSDLELCERLFPSMIISGDDYNLVEPHISDVARSVKYWCHYRGYQHTVYKNRIFEIIRN